MLAVGWLVLAVVLAVLLTAWISFTITRLDRLHARVDAAQAALDAQLVRRAAALDRLQDGRPDLPRLRPPLTAEDRQAAENDVGRSARTVLGDYERRPGGIPADRVDDVAELRETCERVRLTRLFYDDAVRDTRILRQRRLTRALRLAGRRAEPPYFDIDDTVPPRIETARIETARDDTVPPRVEAARIETARFEPPRREAGPLGLPVAASGPGSGPTMEACPNAPL